MANNFIKITVLYKADSFEEMFVIKGEHLKVQDLYDITAEKYNVPNKDIIAKEHHRLKPFTLYLNTDSIAYFRLVQGKRTCNEDETIHGPTLMRFVVIAMKDGNVFVAEDEDFVKQMNIE